MKRDGRALYTNNWKSSGQLCMYIYIHYMHSSVHAVNRGSSDNDVYRHRTRPLHRGVRVYFDEAIERPSRRTASSVRTIWSHQTEHLWTGFILLPDGHW